MEGAWVGKRPTAGQALLLAVVVVVTAVGMGLIIKHGRGTAPAASIVAPSASGTPRSNLPTVDVADLPPEAVAALALIDQGGPYPFKQDGTVFGNFEHRLPERERGYYREFTVVTPGEDDRGRRRLVAGTAGDIYYTDDHYDSFRQVLR
jgi:ribonuclease T1